MDGIWAGKLEGDQLKLLANRYASKTKPYDDLEKKAKAMAGGVKDVASLTGLRELYYKSIRLEEQYAPKDPGAPNNGLPPCLPPEQNDGILNGPLKKGGHKANGEGNRESLKLAIEDLIASYGEQYAKGKKFLARLEKITDENSDEFMTLKKEALLANPLLDFDRLLMVRSRSGNRYAKNWQTQTSVGGPFDNELVVMSPLCEGEVKVLYKPPEGKFVGVNPQPIRKHNATVDFELKDPRSDDNTLFLSAVGTFAPNPWGLYDMHGNAAEWTRSDYKPYPYKDSDGRNGGDKDAQKVVRGGSWHDRPFRSTSSFRLGFPGWQRVYHTGFRVIVEE